MCPGNTHTIDGGNHSSYRWYTQSNDNISNNRYLNVTQRGHYYLEATGEDGCSLWGDIIIDIGDDALQAEILLTSQATVGDTLYLFEITNVAIDSAIWDYDTNAFSNISKNDVYNHSYILLLECKKEGIYNIALNAFSGGCYSPAIKEIEVLSRTDTNIVLWAPIESIIKQINLYPNPTAGDFTVEVILREIYDISLTVYQTMSGRKIKSIKQSGQEKYTISCNLANHNSGSYMLRVVAGRESKQVKIIKN
jgi:hypothetical protein